MENIGKKVKLGFKLLAAYIAFMFVYGIITGPSYPEFVDTAKDDLFLDYHENIYGNARCDAKEFDGHWVLFCHPDDIATGGLFEVQEINDYEYRLYSMNGKASTHIGKLGGYAPYSSIGLDAGGIIKAFKDDF